MCSLWSRHHRGSSSSSTEQESQRESVWICNNKSRIVPCLSPGTYTTAATEQGPTGKAEYSERGPLSLREHGGETYSWSTRARRSTLTPHLSYGLIAKTAFLPGNPTS